jgi:hypothetical protein
MDDKILSDACWLYCYVFKTGDEYVIEQIASNMVISLLVT